MPENTGRITKVQVGVESTFGTKASSLTTIPFLEFDPAPRNQTAQDDSAIGRIEKGLQRDLVREWSEPTLTTILRQDNAGIFLKAILGTVNTSTDTPEAGVNTHAFTVKNDNDPVSLTITFEDANEEEMIRGCVVNTASIEMLQEDYVKLTLSFIGKKQASDTDAASYSADKKFTGKMLTAKFATTVAGLGAAAAIPFQSCNFEINKNAEAIFAVGDTEPTNIINKTFEITGGATLIQTSETYRDLYLANTIQAASFTLTDTDTTIGAATNPSVDFVLAKIYVTEYAAPRSVDDITTQDLSFTANYDITDNMIDSTLVNETVSY